MGVVVLEGRGPAQIHRPTRYAEKKDFIAVKMIYLLAMIISLLFDYLPLAFEVLIIHVQEILLIL